MRSLTTWRKRSSYRSNPSGKRSFKSKKRWFTLFTLTRIAQPFTSPRAWAYPVIERHSAFVAVAADVRLLMMIPPLMAEWPLQTVRGPASRRPQTANHEAGHKCRRAPKVLRGYRSRGSARPREQEFYPHGVSLPSGGR